MYIMVLVLIHLPALEIDIGIGRIDMLGRLDKF